MRGSKVEEMMGDNGIRRVSTCQLLSDIPCKSSMLSIMPMRYLRGIFGGPFVFDSIQVLKVLENSDSMQLLKL